MGGVAIVGAGGFVGARLLELAAHDGRRDIVPIVRAHRSVARTAHLGTLHRIGDASDPVSLGAALSGCDVVVNLTMGEASEVLPIAKSVYAAAVAAGARLVIHLSSATVYGGIERSDLAEDAPPRADHWMPYARQKGLAEDFLRGRMAGSGPRIVVLRPGLIWGPGSPWVEGPGAELVHGSAYLVGDGSGICNLMYVDDLVRRIFAVVDHAAPVSGFYNVADSGPITWAEYYAALASAVGASAWEIQRLPAGPYHAGLRERLGAVRDTPLYRGLKERLPLETRTRLKLRLARARGATSSAGAARPAPTRTMWELQRTRAALPAERFAAAFGPTPRTPFADAIAASAAWLGFIGVDEREQMAYLAAPRSASVA